MHTGACCLPVYQHVSVCFLRLKAAGVVQPAPWEEVSESPGACHFTGPASHCAQCDQRYIVQQLFFLYMYSTWCTCGYQFMLKCPSLLRKPLYTLSLSFIVSPVVILTSCHLVDLSSLTARFESWATQALMRPLHNSALLSCSMTQREKIQNKSNKCSEVLLCWSCECPSVIREHNCRWHEVSGTCHRLLIMLLLVLVLLWHYALCSCSRVSGFVILILFIWQLLHNSVFVLWVWHKNDVMYIWCVITNRSMIRS